jgi:group I intron endonuclease
MKYTIYKTTNLINNKIYIGKHQTENINDSYYGSGKALKASIKKHGKENFKKEILFVFDTELEMNDKEVELITAEFVARTDTYNMGVGGEGGAHFKGKSHSKETIQRIRENLKSKDWSHRKGIPAHNKGKKDSEETRKRKSMASSARGPMSEETKRKISESLKQRACG